MNIEDLDLSVSGLTRLKRMGIDTTDALKLRMDELREADHKVWGEVTKKLTAFLPAITPEYENAVKLHHRILTSYNLVQKNLWDMCMDLKQMRDEKLYKELGYTEFNDYTQKELGMSDRNVYRYISVVEKIDSDLVTPVSLIGIKKLSLLATLSGDEQAEISEKVNLETTTYKELKAEIDKLKKDYKESTQLVESLSADRKKLEEELENAKNKGNEEAVKELEEKIQALKDRNCVLMDKVGKAEEEAEKARKKEDRAWGKLAILETNNQEYKTKIEQLEQENEELRNRPIDVAVVDNSAENDRKLNEVIRSLERENMKRNEELEQQYREDEKAVRKMLEKEKQQALSQLREEYEKKLAEAPQSEPIDEDKLKFKVYLTSTFDMLNRLTEFTYQNSDPIYKEKIKQLLNSVLAKMEE